MRASGPVTAVAGFVLRSSCAVSSTRQFTQGMAFVSGANPARILAANGVDLRLRHR